MSEQSIVIEVTEQMTEDDWRVLTTWREHVFSPEGLGTDWVGGNMHIRASADGEAVGHIGFDIYPLLLDGEEHRCIGVGAVVVVPGYQGQRLPRRMFDTLRTWRDQTDAGLPLVLFCPESLTGYYQKNHGFEEIADEVYYLQKGRYRKSAFHVMADQPIESAGGIYIPSNPW